MDTQIWTMKISVPFFINIFITFATLTTGFLTLSKPRSAKNVLCQIFDAASMTPFNAGPYECQTKCESQANYEDSLVLMNVGCTKKFDLTIFPPSKYICIKLKNNQIKIIKFSLFI